MRVQKAEIFPIRLEWPSANFFALAFINLVTQLPQNNHIEALYGSKVETGISCPIFVLSGHLMWHAESGQRDLFRSGGSFT